MWPSIWEWSGYRLQTHQGFCCGSVTIISFFIMHLLTGNCAFLQLPLSKTFPSVFFMFFLSLPSRKYKLRSTKKKVTWSMACEEKPDRSCDLTEFDLHYLGIYVLRVRANLNGNHSDWVQKEFCPDKEGELERERGGRMRWRRVALMAASVSPQTIKTEWRKRAEQQSKQPQSEADGAVRKTTPGLWWPLRVFWVVQFWTVKTTESSFTIKEM